MGNKLLEHPSPIGLGAIDETLLADIGSRLDDVPQWFTKGLDGGSPLLGLLDRARVADEHCHDQFAVHFLG
jgi:hypothetical protein